MTTRRTLIAALIALLLIPASLFAADSKKEELRKRIRERAPEIQRLKDAGTIGEADDGYVDFVEKKDSKAASVVDAENADRREVYEAVAKDNPGESVENVAKQAAQKRFDKAKPGDWLRIKGKWKKKA